MLHAIIMAGGTGTRFWPASRNDSPKQLLRLVGEATMLRQTLDRLGDLVPNERRMVVTNKRLVEAMREQLPELPAAAIVGEPCKRDTAPCIGLAALLVSRNDPDATMVVMPADHVIRPAEKFQAAIRQAAAMVDESPGRIVTFGIQADVSGGDFWVHPPRARRSERARAVAAGYVPSVKQFKEKPDAATAKKYVDSGEYYWNSGIFVWRAAHDSGRPAKAAAGNARVTWKRSSPPGTRKDRDAVFEREFTAIKPISIDYAVMEHATDVAVIEAPFEWDDLGGWQSLARLAGQRRERQHDRRQAPGPGHERHDRPDRRRSPGRHARREGLHHRPHAERHARGQQAQRGANPPGREEVEELGWTDYL